VPVGLLFVSWRVSVGLVWGLVEGGANCVGVVWGYSNQRALSEKPVYSAQLKSMVALTLLPIYIQYYSYFLVLLKYQPYFN
jgi:hypothetical protein